MSIEFFDQFFVLQIYAFWHAEKTVLTCLTRKKSFKNYKFSD